jgi:hypothetical protein
MEVLRCLLGASVKFKDHKTWWNSLTKEQKQELRHLAEIPVKYDDLPEWSQNNVKRYFETHKEFMEAEASFLRDVQPELKPTFSKPFKDRRGKIVS